MVVVTEAKVIEALVGDGGGMMCMFGCVFAMCSVVVAHCGCFCIHVIVTTIRIRVQQYVQVYKTVVQRVLRSGCDGQV